MSKLRWVKVTIIKNGEDVFYELVNSVDSSTEEEYMKEVCMDVAEREGIGQTTHYSYRWEYVDFPPEDILIEAIRRQKNRIAGAKEQLNILVEFLTESVLQKSEKVD
jgi:hypothetical protein